MLKYRNIKNGGHILTLILLLGVFLLLFSEDRQFKQWNETYQHSFRWFHDMEYWCRIKLASNDRILIDMSELTSILEPFQSSPGGGLRRILYRRLAPDMVKHINEMQKMNTSFWVSRLGRTGRFRYLSFDGFSGIKNLRVKEHRAVPPFMRSHQISYYICAFSRWAQTKAVWENFGYRLIYNNPVFMVFILDSDDSKI